MDGEKVLNSSWPFLVFALELFLIFLLLENCRFQTWLISFQAHFIAILHSPNLFLPSIEDLIPNMYEVMWSTTLIARFCWKNWSYIHSFIVKMMKGCSSFACADIFWVMQVTSPILILTWLPRMGINLIKADSWDEKSRLHE